MIIGDTGKACLFDISMGQKINTNIKLFENDYDNDGKKIHKGGLMKYSTPAKDWKNSMGQ